MGNFVTIGSADGLSDNELAAYEVGPRRIAVARVDGTLAAFEDTCTHAACSLAEGELEGKTVVCPCHMGTFDINTGEVLDGPPPEPVQVYPVRLVDGNLQVEI